MNPKLFVLVLSVGSAIGLANTGTATGGEVPQIAVSYQGLDLSRPADARVMYARLQRAASAVCQPVPAAGAGASPGLGAVLPRSRSSAR